MFKPEQRTIFKYHDGTRERWADPISIQMEIAKRIKEFDKLEKLVRLVAEKENLHDSYTPSEKDVEAINRFLDIICEIFRVKRFTDESGKPEGLTVPQINRIYLDFVEFTTELKNDSGPSATSPQTTEQQCSAPSKTMNSTAPSGSTANGQPSDADTPQLLESESLSAVGT